MDERWLEVTPLEGVGISFHEYDSRWMIDELKVDDKLISNSCNSALIHRWQSVAT